MKPPALLAHMWRHAQDRYIISAVFCLVLFFLVLLLRYFLNFTLFLPAFQLYRSIRIINETNELVLYVKVGPQQCKPLFTKINSLLITALLICDLIRSFSLFSRLWRGHPMSARFRFGCGFALSITNIRLPYHRLL